MAPNTTAREQARRLYFQSNFTQQQIADTTGVNVRTVFDWINQGDWKRAKDMVLNAPTFLAEQYYTQLAALNNVIAARTEAPYPTKEESEIMRRVTGTLKTVKTKQTRSQLVDMLADFSAFAADHSPNITKLLNIVVGEYLKLMSGDGPAQRLARLKAPKEAAEKHRQHIEEMLQFDEELAKEEETIPQPVAEEAQQQRTQLQEAIATPPEAQAGLAMEPITDQLQPLGLYGLDWIDYLADRGISPKELISQVDAGYSYEKVHSWMKILLITGADSFKIVESIRKNWITPQYIIPLIHPLSLTPLHEEVLTLYPDYQYPPYQTTPGPNNLTN